MTRTRILAGLAGLAAASAFVLVAVAAGVVAQP